MRRRLWLVRDPEPPPLPSAACEGRRRYARALLRLVVHRGRPVEELRTRAAWRKAAEWRPKRRPDGPAPAC